MSSVSAPLFSWHFPKSVTSPTFQGQVYKGQWDQEQIRRAGGWTIWGVGESFLEGLSRLLGAIPGHPPFASQDFPICRVAGAPPAQPCPARVRKPAPRYTAQLPPFTDHAGAFAGESGRPIPRYPRHQPAPRPSAVDLVAEGAAVGVLRDSGAERFRRSRRRAAWKRSMTNIS